MPEVYETSEHRTVALDNFESQDPPITKQIT